MIHIEALPSVDRYIKGVIKQEIYYNEENSFGIYIVEILETTEETDLTEVTIKGHFLRPTLDEVYSCSGEWIQHAKFGEQYSVNQLTKELPQTRDAIIKYLSSSLFKGIGKKTAAKIVSTFGEDALDKISSSPETLTRIKGITLGKAQNIAGQIQEQFAFERAMVFLYQRGIGSVVALKIIQVYKEDTISVIKQNPYKLIEDIEGIGFFRADEIASREGIEKKARERFVAAVLYVLREASADKGHVFLTWDQLNQGINTLLGSEAENLFPIDDRRQHVEYMSDSELILVEDDYYYMPSLYWAEYGLASRIKKLLYKEELEFPIADFYRVLGELEEEWDVAYAEQQREAMLKAISTSFMILTGGPGTGKTTVVRGICNVFARLNEYSLDPTDYKGKQESFPILLVAPTGRAAKRLSETTGLPALTIHKLLGWKGSFFERNADYPLEGKLIIIDEASMLDIWLANQLFRAIPNGMKVILVGDQDQLPSVGPGQVLHQLLEVEDIPRVELTDIFRQSKDSSIIPLAHAIKRGAIPEDLEEPRLDRRFFPCDKERIMAIILQTIKSALKKGFHLFDIQVLAPIYKGPVGVNKINESIQQLVNPKMSGKKELQWGDGFFRIGDKVLQLMNHQEQPVCNGDIGVISAIDERANSNSPAIWVQFDRLEVGYKRSQLNQISLAYACSVHKAQGSEFQVVIFPLLHAYRRMLQRNLIYTGITRSKSYLILCGERKALQIGVEKEEIELRNCRLKALILE